MANQTHPPAGPSHHGAAPRPEPLDPERDIDAKTTTIWAVSWAVVLFLSLYLMLVLFDRVLLQERQRKIDNLPAEELQDVVGAERAYLEGESASKKTIEQVMKEMVR